MITSIGSFLVGFASIVSLFASFAAWMGQKNDAAAWKRSSVHAMQAAVFLLSTAVLFLLFSFLTDRFEIGYVYSHSSRLQPIYLKISALWAGQEGSLLLWSFMQALFSYWAIHNQIQRQNQTVYPAAVVLNLLVFFFSGLTFLFQNPFTGIFPIPVDGSGMNPLLRHPGMIFHPPALYIGYVGLSIPFSFAVAALVLKKYQYWTRPLHAWTLFSWFGLGIGLLLGMRWAYDVLGWGGYWGWDPVENAGLMPWLTSTALIHGFVLQDEKHGFYGWNIFLAVISYALVLFGTFITRSGMIQSVHAYSLSSIRFILLAGIAAAVLVPLFIYLKNKIPVEQTEESMPSLFSRVGLFYLTVILLLILTFSILLGTLLPTLTDWLTANQIRISPTWFDNVTGPQFALLILIMGVCPLAGISLSGHKKSAPIYVSLGVGILFAAFTTAYLGFNKLFSIAGFFLIAFSMTAGSILLVQRIVKRTQESSSGLLKAVADIMSSQQRKNAGLITHLGLILLALGIIGSRLYVTDEIVTLTKGQSMDIGAYQVEYVGIEQNYSTDFLQTQADLSISRNGAITSHLKPILNQFESNEDVITVPAVRSSIRDDLYIILAGWSDEGENATFQIYINPLINFVWFGGILFLAGGYLALTPRFSKKSYRNWYLLFGLGLLLLSVWAIWGIPRGVESTQFSRPKVGAAAPVLDGLQLSDGEELRAADLQGKIVVVNFWAPWCPSCREELPALQTIWEEYANRGVVVVGITYESDLPSVNQTIETYGLTFPAVMDEDGENSMNFSVTGVPETYIIDRDGLIAYAKIGASDLSSLESALQEILMEP